MNETNKLRAELAQVRRAVCGQTFEQAPEPFKVIESLKVRIRRIERRVRREQLERRG